MKDGYQQIERYMKEIGPHLERAGVPEKARSMPTGDISQIKPDLQIRTCEFVLDVYLSEEYSNVIRARELVSEEMWAKYEAYGIHNETLQEQVIYNEALSKLRKRWNQKRPAYFGKHYPPYEETFQDGDLEDSA